MSRFAALPVAFASSGDPIRAGQILLAPRDHHLLIRGEAILVMRGPRENGFRPAIDPLFRTAAQSLGPRVTAVVLSGLLDDGAYGCQEVKRCGGTTVVQDPQEALFGSMPLAAIRTGCVDRVLPAAEIGGFLVASANGSASRRVRDEAEAPVDRSERGRDELDTVADPENRLTCPECGGSIRRSVNGRRLTCHVGHAFSATSFLAAHTDAVERALWTALRSLEESAALRRQMAVRAGSGGLEGLAASYRAQSKEAQAKADLIRELVTAGSPALFDSKILLKISQKRGTEE